MVERAPRRLRRVALAFAVLLAGTAPAAAQSRAAAEPDVKAAFVYQFGKFVDWPADALDGVEQLTICVVGDAAFAATLDGTLRDKTLHERRVAVRAAEAHDGLRDCHVLFIAAPASAEIPAILDAADRRPILTIADRGELVAAGVMIDFVRDGARLRFAINIGAAQRAGLTMSSQLLKLAVTVVHDAPSP